MGLMTYINAAFITAFMVFVLVAVFGAGGGLKVAWDLGVLATKVPVWIWAVLVVVFLFGNLFGGKK